MSGANRTDTLNKLIKDADVLLSRLITQRDLLELDPTRKHDLDETRAAIHRLITLQQACIGELKDRSK